MTSSLGHKQFVFSAWIPPGALNAIFSGVPIFLEAFAPLSIELQRGNPSTGANVRDVNSVRRCVVCTSAPGLFWKPSPPLLLLALILFPGPWFFIFFFYNPPRPSISGHQDSKPPSSDEQQPCAENSFRVHPHSPPQFLCSWMFALSYFIGELCYLHEMWPGLARECLQRHTALLPETLQWDKLPNW